MGYPSNVIYESKLFSRVTEVLINRKKLVTPTYFPAVSSYGIKYSFNALVHLLTVYSYPRLLISAYDFNLLDNKNRKDLACEVNEYSDEGCFVFLDSGIYESFWKADTNWTFDLYKTLISQIDFDFYSSFDVLPYSEDRTLKFTKDTLDGILTSKKMSNKSGLIPILHGINPDSLVSLVTNFMEKYPNLSSFIAVPERDCGNDIIEKAQTIIRIRKVLDSTNRERILHILGCGNPLSLVLFSYCGANMFDSLDWIKYVIDQNRLTINDFSHLELTDCECAICSGMKRNYVEKVLLHNLLFYQDYMLQIQSLIRKNEILKFLCNHIGQDIVRRIDHFET